MNEHSNTNGRGARSNGAPPQRAIGLWMATALVLGNMIGSGVFLLPSSLAAAAGPCRCSAGSSPAPGAVLLALVFANPGRAFPAVGGPYAYAHRAFGNFIGFQTAWGRRRHAAAGDGSALRPFRSPVRVDLTGVGDDPVRREIDERSAGMAEAMREQRQVASMVPAEVVDEQVRRREDRREEPEDEPRHEEGDNDDDDKDRQRRAHQEPEEHNGRDVNGAERISGSDACERGVLLEPLGW